MTKPFTKTGGYSKEFTPADPARAKQYALAQIPPAFWRRVQSKAKGRKISLRALILGLLKRWLDGDIEHPAVGQRNGECQCTDPTPSDGSCRACGGLLPA